ncbi:MAG TPA: hypothetical protein VHN14_00505 [Kofleriaceae bacterium]|jgi:hypothetical protein|nr:hypothetical protein [Kofleriaceae bacterium]
MNELILTGLDGQNPLGFFAALGLLRVLDDDALRRNVPRPALQFPAMGEPVPTVRSDLALDAIIGVVLEDARQQGENHALQFAYTEQGERAVPGDSSAVHDLKPPPSLAKALLEECAPRARREAALVAGWFSELVQDHNGNTKPTALHFTAGQQSFLEMVDELRQGITSEDVREALLGPWLNTSRLPSLSWDSSIARNYALRASNPSKEKRGSVAAANWLGVIAMEFFPVVPSRDKLVTTGVRGGWKDSMFTWPLWDRPLTASTVAALLRIDLRRMRSSEWAAFGVIRGYEAAILRSDQGGYGSFSPAAVIAPYRKMRA